MGKGICLSANIDTIQAIDSANFDTIENLYSANIDTE